MANILTRILGGMFATPDPVPQTFVGFSPHGELIGQPDLRIRLLNLLSKVGLLQINRSEAAMLLNVSEKTIQRLAKRCREKGLIGLKHGNLRRKPKNATADEIARIILVVCVVVAVLVVLQAFGLLPAGVPSVR